VCSKGVFGNFLRIVLCSKGVFITTRIVLCSKVYLCVLRVCCVF
jgi:hypothetical protein